MGGVTLSPRLRRLGRLVLDPLVAALLAVLLVADVLAKHSGVAALLVGVVVVGTVAWRQRAPAVAALVAIGGIALFKHLGGSSPAAGVVAVLDFYALGRRSMIGAWKPLDVLLVLLLIPAIAVSPQNKDFIDVASVWAYFVAIPFMAGAAITGHRALSQELGRKAEWLERELRERSLRAGVTERTRIARELHDVVAHNMSVIVIQAEVARRVAPKDREAAREALRWVERCGRDALVDTRRMVGVLHRDEIELARPGLSQLSMLVQGAAAAGLSVEVSVEGEPRELTPGVDLVAYRVVQEALTNAIKHAGPTRARVRVEFAEDALRLEICDSGKGSPRTTQPVPVLAGHGLIGMRERLELYGGVLQAGLGEDGGYRVLATLPLGASASV